MSTHRLLLFCQYPKQFELVVVIDFHLEQILLFHNFRMFLDFSIEILNFIYLENLRSQYGKFNFDDNSKYYFLRNQISFNYFILSFLAQSLT